MESSSSEEDLRTQVRQQEVVADLGQQALENGDLEQLLHDATMAVAETLDTEYANVLELLPGGDEALLRAGVGWPDGLVGEATVSTQIDSQGEDTLRSETPVVVEDLRAAEGFGGLELVPGHDVVSTIVVVIGTVEDPWGVLGAYTTARRDFTDDEADFVHSVARILASAVEREKRERELTETLTELQESEERLRLALEAGEMGVWELDVQTEDSPNRSPEHDRIFGYEEPLDEWDFETFLNHVHPDDRQEVKQCFERASETGAWDVECRITRADGEERAISVQGEFYSDDEGEPERAVGVVQDVTERKRNEQALTESERRYHSLAENFPTGGVGVFDDDLRYTFVTGTMWDDIEPDAADLEGETIYDALPPETAADVEPVFRGALAGESGSVVSQFGGRTYRIWATPLRDADGNVTGGQSFALDITDQRERERELAESERRYRTLAENFPNGAVGLVDENLRYQTIGGSPTDTGDVTVEKAEGSYVEDVLPDSLAEELVPRYEAALDGESSSFEFERDGRIFHFRIEPVRNDDGEVSVALGMSQDITERREYENRLAESERRYRTLVENFPNGSVALFNENLKYTAVGGQLLDTLDMEPESRVGRTISEIHPEPLVEEIEPHFRAALAGGSSAFEVEFQGRHLSAQTLPVESADGEIDGGMVVVQDVTDQREYERELQRKERRYQAVFEDPNILVGLLEPDGSVLGINQTAMEYIEADLDAVRGEPFWETPWWGEGDGIQADVREWTERAAAGEYVDFEADLTRPDGERYTLDGYFRPVTDEAGEVASIIVSQRDITERRKRERELQESRKQLRAMVDVLPVAVFVADADGEIVEWNKAGEEIWGGEVAKVESVEEYVEYEAWWVDTGERLEPDEWALARVLEGEEVTDPDKIRIKGFDGEYRTVLNHGMPVLDADGEVSRAVVTLVDITEREEYQRKLEESNERLEQFAYAASHDLQEPLRMVSSYLQLLEDRYAEDLDAEAEEFIEFAVDGADRMREMIGALLEYSRVEAEGDPLEPTDLESVVDHALDDLQVRIEETDATVALGSLPTVAGDDNQLRQVFQNLVKNALDYSGDEPPRVEVTAERHGDEWVVSVEDEGIGIDPDDADRVFGVFERLHSQDEHSGTGIGLALCERIVERHGGDIWVDSEPGTGATFSFTLPAADSFDGTGTETVGPTSG
jgi:PAS domain S-box-containing protein